MGFFDAPAASDIQSLLRSHAKVPLGSCKATGMFNHQIACETALELTFNPLPTWYAPFEEERLGAHRTKSEFPYHALTQRPAAMYHSWGFPKRLAASNPHQKPALCPRWQFATTKGLKDGDWAWVSSWHGKIKVRDCPHGSGER